MEIPQEAPKEFQFMSWEQAKEIKNTINLGSHTLNHPILTHSHFYETEIIDPAKIIQEKTGVDVKSFCYPNGDHSKREEDVAKNIYSMIFTTKLGINTIDDKFQIKRIAIDIKDDVRVLGLKLTPIWRLLKKS